MTQRKKLPVGIQTLAKIRSDDYYYIDKTQLAIDLVQEGIPHYFLSRPRRFGKSLFLDTLKELFEGNEKLFKGLAAEKQWNWSVQYPVIRFSFAGSSYAEKGLAEQEIQRQLKKFAQVYGLTFNNESTSGRFKELILHLEKQAGQRVVVLVDEYDKPILDTMHAPEFACNHRDFLIGFYSVLKDSDAHIKFSFLTGVSKFSMAGIFSGLNNLYDLTLVARYATICGYTNHDIDTVFADELPGLDRQMIRDWYNGYHWLGEGVYNPFDILQLFKNREFRNYWFETGTPTFLIDLLFSRQFPIPKLDKLISTSSVLSSFDVEDIAMEALLFQTGYLTIKKRERLGGQEFYTLGYPNQEVYQSLNENLLSVLVKDNSTRSVQTAQLYRLLLVNDFAGLQQLFHAFFASIPHHWYTNSQIQTYEGYYASVFYSYFASLGLDVTVEDITNLGRIDMTLKFNEQVYIFEFKVVEMVPEGNALQQIKDKAYADKYRSLKQPIHLIGVEFSKDSRNIVGFGVEQA